VASFLDKGLGFTSIPVVIERVLNAHEVESVVTLELIRRVDAWTREHAAALAGELQSIG
jgi:1-deoxy-D-xylulose 5-phosphate reductoisomerase